MTATPAYTSAHEWAQYGPCHICAVPAGVPCRNKLEWSGSPERHRPHPERLVAGDRDGDGVLVLGRPEPGAAPRPGGKVPAWHALTGGVTVCAAAPVPPGQRRALTEVETVQRCKRQSCRRVWRAAEEAP